MSNVGLFELGFGLLFFLIIGVIIGILPFWMMFSKAGYSGALSLLLLVPIANVIVLFVVAFSDWPVLRELRQWRQWAQQQQQPPAAPRPPVVQ